MYFQFAKHRINFCCGLMHVFQHLSPCKAIYQQCKTIVLNSIIIVIQCVQGNFYNNNNLHAFNFDYLNIILKKVLTGKLFQIDTT